MRKDHHPKRPRIFRNLKPLVLASGSPRRKELLLILGLEFEVCPAALEEPPWTGGLPEDYALSLAENKATAVFKGFPDHAVLAADTIVVSSGRVLGKPKDKAQAQEMLKALSGRWHQVITAYALFFQKERRLRVVVSEVLFKELSQEEIKGYLLTGEPFDKAGAYAIQGIASYMVRAVKGSVTNIIGLPLTEVVEDLLNLGIISLVES